MCPDEVAQAPRQGKRLNGIPLTRGLYYCLLKKSLRFAAAHLSAIAMSASLLLAGVPRAYADDHKKCEERIEKTEAKLDEAIRHHGERSSQAEHRRHELNEERERCWNAHHGWWNGAEHRWHTEHDWDHVRDDRDRDDRHDDHR